MKAFWNPRTQAEPQQSNAYENGPSKSDAYLTRLVSKQLRVVAVVEIIRNEKLLNPDRSSSGKIAIQAEVPRRSQMPIEGH